MDPVRFWDFYESKGWVIGKSPMKDWRAAVRTWERGERGTSNGNGYGGGFSAGAARNENQRYEPKRARYGITAE
jgi:hypothetical protein